MSWPKGKPRGPRAQATTQTGAAAYHPDTGRAIAMGRDGQELTRKRTVTSDAFHIPHDIVPKDWTYQWNVHDVMGQPQTAQRLAMAENGWRPVPASRHPGYFMPEGYEGSIIRDGLILEERPAILDEEARQEENSKAIKLVRDQQEQLMLSKKGALGAGFSDDPKYRGVGAQINRTIAPASDIPRPRLQIDPAG